MVRSPEHSGSGDSASPPQARESGATASAGEKQESPAPAVESGMHADDIGTPNPPPPSSSGQEKVEQTGDSGDSGQVLVVAIDSTVPL